jgi:cyclophilin family peptidyl-prolyl cis-trans isomerase
VKKTLVIGLIAALGLACLVMVNGCKPNRLTPDRALAAREVELKLAEAEREQEHMHDENEAETVHLLERVPPPDAYEGGKGPEHATLTAPDTFLVEFVCSNGNFVIQCHREWAPVGVDRFYNLVVQGFFDGARFFRVVPGFVVQFGLNGEPALSAKWKEAMLQDEPVKKGNQKATITFAKSSQPNSRTTQLFINLADNSRLDAMGFSAFGEVTMGMNVVEDITAKYGEEPNQMMIQEQGNEYLKTNFPDMDYIKEAYVGELKADSQ